MEHDFDIIQSEPSRANLEASGNHPGWVAHTLPLLGPPVPLAVSSGVLLFHFHMLVDTLPVQVSLVYYLNIFHPFYGTTLSQIYTIRLIYYLYCRVDLIR